LGIGILSNPRNIGQGLAAGLQSARSAKEAEAKNKIAEAQLKKYVQPERKWFTDAKGRLSYVDESNPMSGAQVVPGQPERETWKIIERNGRQYQQEPGTGRLFDMPGQADEKVFEPKVVGEGQQLVDPRTGKVILQGQPKMSPALQKEMASSEDEARAGAQSINTLKALQEQSKKAWGNALAPGASTYLAPFSKGAQDTVILDNMVKGEALNNLKSTFGGMPTEGERKILIEIQGSSSLPDAVRQDIYSRALKQISARTEYNRAKAQAISDGSYRDPNSAFSKKYRQYINAEQGGATGSVETAPEGQPQPAPVQRQRMKFNPATGMIE